MSNLQTHLQAARRIKGFNMSIDTGKNRKTNMWQNFSGEFYVTRNKELIDTILGSCVSPCI